MAELQLGKLEAVHPPSPVYLQRAAILAILAFIFFVSMLIVFSYRQHFGYFLLATAFLLVEIFTLIGWFTQRKSEVKIYENGFRYKKQLWFWDEIESATTSKANQKIRSEVKKKTGEKIILSEMIYGVESIINRIESELAKRKSLI